MAILVHAGDLETPPRPREVLRQRHRRAAATTEFARALDALGITQRQAARLFNVNVRHVRRWRHGDRHVPRGVSIVLNLLIAQKVTLAEVEQAAASIPVQTNGGAKPGQPASRFVAPAPDPFALVRAEATTLTNLDQTTAAVFGLTATACRWPLGDPGAPGFRFCGKLVERESYCECHHIMAHMAFPARSSA
jgi:hypothetical protein